MIEIDAAVSHYLFSGRRNSACRITLRFGPFDERFAYNTRVTETAQDL